MAPDPRHPVSAPERDTAATKRSYVFLVICSVLLWAMVMAGAVAAHASGRAGVGAGAFGAICLVATGTLVGWLAFLRGLRRRDLQRVQGARSTARSRRIVS